MHPQRPRGGRSGREKRRDEGFQAQAEKPLGTDSHRTISKRSSECWLLIGHKKCFVLLCPIGEQLLLSSFREFVHDRYYFATVARFVHQAFLTRQKRRNYRWVEKRFGSLWTKNPWKFRELIHGKFTGFSKDFNGIFMGNLIRFFMACHPGKSMKKPLKKPLKTP